MLKAVKMHLLVVAALTLIGFSGAAGALDEASTITENGTKIVAMIEKEFSLQLSSKNKRQIYDQFSFALTAGWWTYWLGNSDFSMASDQVKNSKNRVMDFLFVSGERVFNLTLHHFPEARQIIYYRKEIRVGSSTIALETFNKEKLKAENVIQKETDQYAVLQRKGFVDFDVFMLSPPNAVATYWDGGVLDLK